MPHDNYEFFSGLVYYNNEISIPVPLKNVEITSKVIDFVTEVVINQKYVNQEKNPIEVVYMFPIEESAAVTKFEAEVDNRTIVTDVKSKNEAINEYNKSIFNKKTAVLFEETTPDIYKIKVGHINPGSEVKIKIVYIAELPVDDNCIRLTIPTVIAPRYKLNNDNSEATKDINLISYSSEKQHFLKFNLEVLGQTKFKSIKSPSHKELSFSIKDVPNEHGQYVATGEFTNQEVGLDKDIVVVIENIDPYKPIVYIEKSENDTLVGMVTLIPKFKLDNQKIELVFLVDRSGSMGSYNGKYGSICNAKNALNIFLHSLPSDCYFNIYSFGSSFNSLFKGCQKYDDKTLTEAKSHVSCMTANYGGTEIYKPLEAIFKEEHIKGYLRQIFVLTDGEVTNTESVIELAKKYNSKARIFSIGLGSSASRHLVKGIARVTNGIALFAAEDEDIRPKVMSQLKNAMQPAISEINIDWEGVKNNKEIEKLETEKTLIGYMKPIKSDNKNIKSDFQAPTNIPVIYDGARMLVYKLFFKNQNIENIKNVNIEAITPDGPLCITIPINNTNYIHGQFIHQLAAKKRIQDLEETTNVNLTSEEIQELITELGIKYKIASKYTSFVGVDSKTFKESEVMITRHIKNQIPSGFGFSSYTSTRKSYGSVENDCISLGESYNYSENNDYDCVSSNSQHKFINLISDSVTDLINLQSSDGHFKWNDVIYSQTGFDKDYLMKLKPLNVSEQIWLTIIVITLLQKNTKNKDVWELVVKKANEYLINYLKIEELYKLSKHAKQIINI